LNLGDPACKGLGFRYLGERHSAIDDAVGVSGAGPQRGAKEEILDAVFAQRESQFLPMKLRIGLAIRHAAHVANDVGRMLRKQSYELLDRMVRVADGEKNGHLVASPE
jgi:hypothetical protein